MFDMLEIVVLVIFLMCWILVLYSISRSKEIFIGIVMGFIVFLIVGSLEYYWPTLTGISLTESEGTIIYFPVIEEILKLLFIFLTIWILRLKLKMHKIIPLKKELIIGASVGLGFAFSETIGFSNLLTIIQRGLTTWPMHMLTSTILSFSVSIIWTFKPKRKAVFALALVSSAIIIHSLFNYLMLS